MYVSEGCDSAHIDCDHICVHAEDDRGASCFCYDGYELHTGNGETCQGKNLNCLAEFIPNDDVG